MINGRKVFAVMKQLPAMRCDLVQAWPMLFSLMVSLWTCCFWSISSSSSAAVPTHLDKAKVKMECSECHKGHGKRGTTMLAITKDEFCFQCHSLSGKAGDIYSQLSKRSNHRILETSRYHVQGEELPEKDPSAPRHASCYDCHNVHKSEKDAPLKGIRGYAGKKAKPRKMSKEYEVCYNCHSDSANLGNDDMNVSLDFDSANPSYHPVETYGKNPFVPSLRKGFGHASTINCSDCHGNDDPSGPKGPHGSIYDSILKHRYVRTQGPESPRAYELCYACHERRSILGDESFRAHKVHIVYHQISCAQCHDAHGSRYQPALINFDRTVVFPNSLGEFAMLPTVQGRPRCSLSCHVNGHSYEHKLNRNLLYSINGRPISQW